MSESVAAVIARNIRAAREAAGISQRELGRIAGASTASVSVWEAGERNITAPNLLAVAGALGVSVLSLYGLSDDGAYDHGFAAGYAECRRRVLAAVEAPDAAQPSAEVVVVPVTRETPDPDAVAFPCGKSHVCLTCSPRPNVPGPGCHNCRRTGYEQTPCIPCAESVRVDVPGGAR